MEGNCLEATILSKQLHGHSPPGRDLGVWDVDDAISAARETTGRGRMRNDSALADDADAHGLPARSLRFR
jgi:hypothetical protein